MAARLSTSEINMLLKGWTNVTTYYEINEFLKANNTCIESTKNNFEKIDILRQLPLKIVGMSFHNYSNMKMDDILKSINSNLQIVFFHNCSITFIRYILGFFDSLKEIYISYCCDALSLPQKTNIFHSLFSIPRRFMSLRKLTIVNQVLSNIPTSILSLSNLIYLDLSHNSIESIPVNINSLKKLENLLLDDNCIKSLPITILSLKRLKKINLSYNIFDIFPIHLLEHSSLEQIYISNNKISSLSKKHFLSNFNFISRFSDETNHLSKVCYIIDNPITNPPKEIIDVGKEAVLDYFNESQIPLQEIRVIILGNGEAGKTSLVNVLMGKPIQENNESTWGINIQTKEYSDLKVHFWDFGGQSIMHSTHKFFLSDRCVYVIVLNGRSDENSSRWLEHIRIHGGSSPTFIVVNKVDQCPNADANLYHLRKRHHFIKNNYRISCVKPNEYDMNDFENDLIRHIKVSSTYQTMMPSSWNRIKNEILSKDKIIPLSDFHKICIDNQYSIEKTPQLLEILHNLGIVQYFKNINEDYIYTTKWITNVLYNIITSVTPQSDSIGLSETEIRETIRSMDNTFAKHTGTVISIMINLKLCYRQDDKIIIPCKLKNNPPKIRDAFKDSNNLSIRYSYEYFDACVLHRFISIEHNNILKNYVWKDGVVLYYDDFDALAIVEMDLNSKIIRIVLKSNSEKSNLYGALSSILHTLNNIHNDIFKDYKNQICRCMIPIIINEEIVNYVDIEDIISLKDNNQKYYINPRPFNKIPISQLVGIIEEIDDFNFEKELIGIMKENPDRPLYNISIKGDNKNSPINIGKGTQTVKYKITNEGFRDKLLDLQAALIKEEIKNELIDQEIQTLVNDMKKIKNIADLQEDKKKSFKKRLEKAKSTLDITANVATIAAAITQMAVFF